MELETSACILGFVGTFQFILSFYYLVNWPILKGEGSLESIRVCLCPESCGAP